MVLIPKKPPDGASKPSRPASTPSKHPLMEARALVTMGSPAEFCTNFSQFQLQVAEQRTKQSGKSGETAGNEKKKKKSSSSSSSSNLKGPVIRPTAIASRRGQTQITLATLPGVVGPTVLNGEFHYTAPGHAQLAAEHLYHKACRQYAKRFSQFQVLDAVLRLQGWYRRVVVARRAVRRLVQSTFVGVAVRRIARQWLQRARRTIAARLEVEALKHRRDPLVAAATVKLQCWWRCVAARTALHRMQQANREGLAASIVGAKELVAARCIQSFYRMWTQQRRTRLARLSLKHFRVARVIHQVRFYFFRRQRAKVHKMVQEKHFNCAVLIQRCWRAQRELRQRRANAFAAKLCICVSSV